MERVLPRQGKVFAITSRVLLARRRIVLPQGSVFCATIVLHSVLSAHAIRGQEAMQLGFPNVGVLLGPRVRAPLTVLNRPVVATFRSISTKKSDRGPSVSIRFRGAFYRSRNGNTCTDYFDPSASSDAVSLRIVWNAQRKVLSFLSFSDRTENRNEGETSENAWMPSGPFSLKVTNEKKVIHDMECKRVVLVAIPGEVPQTSHDESWIAFDWGLVMLDVSENGSEEQRWEIIQVDRIEPEASLFEIPPGFAIKH